MTESLITLSIVGLLVGFIFSMPVAGPISILVTSNALNQRLRYSHLVTIGASFADFVYIFAAVFGLTNFYAIYKPFIPYVLLLGTVFLVFLGYKITKTKIDLEPTKEEPHLPQLAEAFIQGGSKVKDKLMHTTLHPVKKRGGFWTGFLLSFFNPTLFINWLTSSFIVISLVSSLGFNTGGLDISVKESYKAMHKADEDHLPKSKTIKYLDSLKLVKRTPTEEELEDMPAYSPWVLSLAYAFFVSLGSIIWFYYLAYLLAKHRHRVNINIVNGIIRTLGFALCILGLFLGYKGINMLF